MAPAQNLAKATDACEGPLPVTRLGPANYALGLTSETFVAVDEAGNFNACDALVTATDTQAPKLTCPPALAVECGAAGPLPPAQAVDNCDSAPKVTSAGALPAQPGKATVTYTATDASGHSVSCATPVTVQDTTPPKVTCPGPAQIECGDKVPKLQAQASDTCGAVNVTQDAPKAWTLGTTTVHFTAKDSSANSAGCTTNVQVIDTLAPKVTVAGLAPMWPPNHVMQTVTLADCGIQIVDACQGELSLQKAGAHITCVTSDEPDNDLGDGNKANDIVIVNATAVQLRRERQGPMDGRVYRIGFEVQDAAGHVTAGTCLATVPHDQNAKAIDSGVKIKVCK